MFNRRYLADSPTMFEVDGEMISICGLCHKIPRTTYDAVPWLPCPPDVKQAQTPDKKVVCDNCHPGMIYSVVAWNNLNLPFRQCTEYTVNLEKELNALYDRFHIILTHCGEALRG